MVSGQSAYSRPLVVVMLVMGGLVILSILVLNPITIAAIRPPSYLHRSDVLAAYPIWAGAIGCTLVALGVTAARLRSERVDNMVLLGATLILFVLADRLLLVYTGLPLWSHDPVLHYRHRANAVRTWGTEFDYKPIRINSHGQHDDEFPLDKAAGEFRALMLGDSVTMGHGVSVDETYANQLERLIADDLAGACPVQVINTGVQGYATFQELVLFRESLVFEPDFATIGFLLNDVTEPWQVNREFGGLGIDYRGIMQVNSTILGYIINETGWGRLASKINSSGLTLDGELLRERYDVVRAARIPPDDAYIEKAWQVTLRDLTEIYSLSEERQIPLLLLIFPFTFQFLDADLQEAHQILKAHAIEHHVDFIDFTEVFEALIFDVETSEISAGNSDERERLLAEHEDRIDFYFLDADHFTPEGHRLVAEHIFAYIRQRGLIDQPEQTCRRTAETRS